tara:strand:- start:4541 stop:4726 length:186 start_codon:yes stop_codon:yes gene_type:complete
MMTYEIAEYKYACHLRDKGYVGELPYPSPKHSKMDEEGNWLLINREGHKLAKVFIGGKVIA